jgi:tRNA threonylcarbamoyladenosine biosynthesis protein TsaB
LSFVVNSEPVILSLETATIGGTIFLARGTHALATRVGDSKVSHSNSLLSDIDECLNEAGLRLADIGLFACASGPGSFTGLRIGIATLKALAATLERPCVGIPTLNAIAQGAGLSNATVALLPAGRGEVFAQMFSISADEVVALDTPAHLSPQDLMARYGGIPDLIWAGPAVHLHRALLQGFADQHAIHLVAQGAESEVAGKSWRLASPDTNLAQNISILALRRFAAGQVQNAESLRAIYVRPSDAEINQSCQ